MALAEKTQTVIGNPTSLENPDTTNISSLVTYSEKEYFVFSWRRSLSSRSLLDAVLVSVNSYTCLLVKLA